MVVLVVLVDCIGYLVVHHIRWEGGRAILAAGRGQAEPPHIHVPSWSSLKVR